MCCERGNNILLGGKGKKDGPTASVANPIHKAITLHLYGIRFTQVSSPTFHWVILLIQLLLIDEVLVSNSVQLIQRFPIMVRLKKNCIKKGKIVKGTM
jgi:hypothetical protein